MPKENKKSISTRLVFNPLVVLVLIALFVVLVLSRNKLSYSSDLTKDFIDKIVEERDRPERFELAKEMFQSLGPEESINALSALRQQDLKYYQTSEIHLLMHVIGEESYKKYGDTAILKCYGDLSNKSGCVHGVILSVINESGLDGIRKIIESCKSEPPYRFRAQCVHGAGHGFMAYTSYDDLLGALEMCDSLKNISNKDLEECYYAVFMENAFGEHNGVSQELHPWLDKNNLSYPCDSIGLKYKNQCYRIQPYWWYQILKDFKVTSEMCLTVAGEHKEACASGFGSLMHVVNKTTDVKSIEINCQKYFNDRNLIDSCLLLANRSGLTRYGFDFAVDICKKISTDYIKKECYESVELFFEGGVPQDIFRNICLSFESEYRYLCSDV